jgi:signal transduction histidine kinase
MSPLPSPTTEPPATDPSAARPTLLIVDDEAGPRESLRIVFKDRYNCAVATCGREGIEYARTHPVDAAILDIKMPDLSGIDVLRELKAIDPNIECIMLTGYETIESARAAVRYGAADYLNKPFDVFSVRELLDKCIARRHSKLAAEQTLCQLQQANQQLAAELTQLKRAVSAAVLSAGVIHEINNPLAIIAGYTELLARDLAALGVAAPHTAQHVQHRLSAIQREIDRCKQITRRFLDFARTGPAAAEPLEVARLLDDAAALLRAHPTNRSAEIHCRPVDPALRVHAQPTELLQVLINLGVNALQAMNGTGTLTLAAEAAEPLPDRCAFRSESFNPDRPHVKISVTDTGCGIAPEKLAKIFQPYFTDKPQGTGLGLAICCELINRASGLIEVESRPGHGSTFTVYLPRAD